MLAFYNLRRERVTASGSEVGRLSIVGGVEIGRLRCWPGGLCLSRSIGDMDIVEFIVPVPYVKQVKEALRSRGLKDDTTCIVVDIIPPDNSFPPSPPLKKQSKLRSLIFKKRSHDSASKLSYPLLVLWKNYLKKARPCLQTGWYI
ncbi:hypothetical protein GIB67_010211 [Kingdonia uniflora]|uniref:Uncharacterized protein n=1 Tax=Kingdonia uniflora TaxID=39325 RepID=A0A7J7NAH9_9MAGN|nr:hypothetical protein GIB67_010211 [Kingdonia uniflora]